MSELRTEIEIKGSANSVWNALMDFSNYPKWNPFIREISGTPTVGSTLSVHIKPKGGMGAKIAPVVVIVEESRVFAWKGKLGIKGIFDGHHEFIIEPVDADRVRFIQREEFTGLLVPILWPMLRTNTRQGFEEMNQALKLLVEGN